LVFFGDGATSTADFHAAMNFAGVFRTPTVFLCNNNQWAISVPVAKQTASATLAQKAPAYGFDGLRVDGMDALAVFRTTRDAPRPPRSRPSSPTCTRRCPTTCVISGTPSSPPAGGERTPKKGPAAPVSAPSSASGLQRAHELFKQGRAKEALALVRPLLQRKGEVDGDACALAAACLGAEGDYAEAARVDRLLCDADPDNPQ